jgi:hypothetical protein
MKTAYTTLIGSGSSRGWNSAGASLSQDTGFRESNFCPDAALDFVRKNYFLTVLIFKPR